MDNPAARDARIYRMARRQGLVAKKQDGKWLLTELLSHKPIAEGPLETDAAEKYLRARDYMPGGQA